MAAGPIVRVPGRTWMQARARGRQPQGSNPPASGVVACTLRQRAGRDLCTRSTHQRAFPCVPRAARPYARFEAEYEAFTGSCTTWPSAKEETKLCERTYFPEWDM